MNKQPDSTNLYLAIGLCLVILIGWEYFFIQPRMQAERERQAKLQQTEAQAKPGSPAAAGTGTQTPGAGAPALPGQSVVASILTRDAALKAGGTRVAFDTPKIDGSVLLTGARIDDLRLKDYHETVDRKSPEIVVLSPAQAPGAYYAEFGWAAAAGATVPLPDSNTRWQQVSNGQLTQDNPLILAHDNGKGLTFRRTIAVDKHYMFTVTDRVTNAAGSALTLYPFAQVMRLGEPKEPPQWLLHEGMIGVLGGSLQEQDYAEMKETPETKVESKGGWLGITDKYWMAALAPPQTETFTGRFVAFDQRIAHLYQADYLLQARVINPGQTVEVTHRLFAGAKVNSLISAYETQLNIYRFDMAIDWGWFWFLTKPIFWLLDWLYKQIGNFGVAILILTVIIKAIFFPLANRSYEAMSKMKKVHPEIQQIQERHKEDRVKLQTELMALYKREKINPLMGCLPILIQIPVFFALYKVLFVTLEMRHAPFFGWIQDLAAPDPTSIVNLFGLIPVTLPQWLVIGVWPILMGITMWIQTKMNPPAQDPMQQQILNWMPLLFTYMLALFPAGLVIYWAWNNVLSIAQQYVIMRRTGTPIEIIDNFKVPPWLTRAFGGGKPDGGTPPA